MTDTTTTTANPLLDPLFAGTVGDMVGNYILRGTLGPPGRGIGSVWRATPAEDDDAPVCLKVARSGTNYESSWRVELACLRATASCAGIVDLAAHFMFVNPATQQTHPCHAIGWVPGGDLFDTMQRNPCLLTPARCIAITGEILDAVAYLHGGMGEGWKVVHNDLKPENILMGADGHIRLTDFGSASILHGCDPDVLGERTRWVQKFGQTTDYRSVEIICGPSVTTAADIWAVGCILFELLTHGETLFTDGEADHDDDSGASRGSRYACDGEDDEDDEDGEDDEDDEDGENDDDDEDGSADSADSADSDYDANEAGDIVQLLVIRECLGPFPSALTRAYPELFSRSGSLRFHRLCESGAPEDLIDARPGSLTVADRLRDAGVAGDFDMLFAPMLRMNPMHRATATAMRDVIESLPGLVDDAVQHGAQ